MIIKISDYSSVISDKSLGSRIYDDINMALSTNKSIVIDLDDVIVMTTFCAKQVFGRLFVLLGQEQFYERVLIRGATSDFKIIIQESIQSAIEGD